MTVTHKKQTTNLHDYTCMRYQEYSNSQGQKVVFLVFARAQGRENWENVQWGQSFKFGCTAM